MNSNQVNFEKPDSNVLKEQSNDSPQQNKTDSNVLKEQSNDSPQQNKTDIVGYVTFTSPTKISAKSNSYFDIMIKTSPNETKKVRVMGSPNSSLKRSLFEAKEESKDPVHITGLSPSKSGISFLNANSGGKLLPGAKMPFPFISEDTFNIRHILDTGVTGLFDLTGKIKWIDLPRTVLVGEKKVAKQIRDGVMADESGHIKISVWEPCIENINEDTALSISNLVMQSKYGVKVTTTTTTKVTLNPTKMISVDWKVIPYTADLIPTKICCPDVVAVKFNEYKQCVNITCMKKVVPFPGETLVSCDNPVCRRKMKVSRCKTVFLVELLLQDLSMKQTQVTIFPAVLDKLFQGTQDQLEEFLLSLEKHDFLVNSKKVAEKICPHS